MILARIMAVLAAISFVLAFSLATMAPPDSTLADVLLESDGDFLIAAQAAVVTHVSAWVWTHLIAPFLERPSWLLPTEAGLVLAAGAMTLGSRARVQSSHRRS